VTDDEFYEKLNDESVNPFRYLTEYEYTLSLKTFIRFTSHPYIYDAYRFFLRGEGGSKLKEFTLHGITFKLQPNKQEGSL